MLFLKDALQHILEERKWDHNKIDVDNQMDEASFIFRRVLKALPEMFDEDPSKGPHSKRMQVTLSLLWTLIVTSLDETLFKQQGEIRNLNSQMDKYVEERVIATRATYEQKIFTLKEVISNKNSVIAERDKQIEMQNNDIYELKNKLRDEAMKVQSFKDPNGCVEFRKVLQDFEQDIVYLTKEKDKQYKAMRLSLRLMEEMEMDEKAATQRLQDERKTKDQWVKERI